MIKRITTLVFSLTICALVAPTAFAASEVSGPTGETTIYGLVGYNEPAFIVSNPLYGFTNTFRGVTESFVFGRTNKVLLRLEVLDRKAAELLKMRIVAPSNEKMFSKALFEYQLAVYQYGFVAAPLTTADIIANDDAEGLVDAIVDAAFTHTRLLDELLAGAAKTTEQAVLSDMLDRFANTNVKLLAEAIGVDSMRVRLTKSSGDVGIISVRNAEALALLAKHAAAVGQNDLAQQLLSSRKAILDDLAATFSAETITELNLLVGSHGERIQTISYLLSLPRLAGNADLINLRNQLLIQVFSK